MVTIGTYIVTIISISNIISIISPTFPQCSPTPLLVCLGSGSSGSSTLRSPLLLPNTNFTHTASFLTLASYYHAPATYPNSAGGQGLGQTQAR